MTSGGNNFNDFPEIVPIRKITTKIEKTSFSRPWPWAYLLHGPNAASSIAPILIRYCTPQYRFSRSVTLCETFRGLSPLLLSHGKSCHVNGLPVSSRPLLLPHAKRPHHITSHRGNLTGICT